MKRILVLAGGSGPQALLEGLAFNRMKASKSFAKVQVLINALDNGLSTGQCRQIFDGKLLGPSDVRKNAMSQFVPKDADEIAFCSFMEQRFNCASSDAEEYVTNEISKLTISDEKIRFLQNAADTFFKRALARTIDYNDFSMANLIYSGVAGQNDLSLTKASRLISKILLDIPEDFVLLNSDESVYINAVTSSGKILTDEVVIDEWDDITDRIKDIFFTDVNGNKIEAPSLNAEAKEAIVNADIIIFSSGTQWTSLIPTYATTGFKEALAASNAKKYLVMNNIADTDMTGLNSVDIVNVLKAYLPMSDITTILNSNAAPDMCLEPDTPWIRAALSGENTKRHDGERLVNCMLEDYFKEPLTAITEHDATYLTDYDDTLVARDGKDEMASQYNKLLLPHVAKFAKNKLAIVTGNSIRSIAQFYGGLTVYADNSTNEYFSIFSTSSAFEQTPRYKLVGSVDESLLFTQEEVNDLRAVITEECGIDISKVTNKGYAGVAIRPLVPEYRAAIRKLIEYLVDEKYAVVACGRTTIDIYKKGVTKLNVINKYLAEGGKIVYAGDEWDKGNDADIYQLSLTNKNITYLKVNDPSDTALFFYTIERILHWE